MDAHACPLKFGSCKLFLDLRAVGVLWGQLHIHSEQAQSATTCDEIWFVWRFWGLLFSVHGPYENWNSEHPS